MLHHIPGLEFLNGTDTIGNLRMWILLAAGMAVYAVVTFVSCRVAMKRFERVDMRFSLLSQLKNRSAALKHPNGFLHIDWLWLYAEIIVSVRPLPVAAS